MRLDIKEFNGIIKEFKGVQLDIKEFNGVIKEFKGVRLDIKEFSVSQRLMFNTIYQYLLWLINRLSSLKDHL